MAFRTLALLLAATSVQAAELEGVRLDDRVHVDGRTLELNGIAVRTRFYFKTYVAGLYLPAKMTSASRAIQGEGPKRIVLVMMRDASAGQFRDSIQVGLEKNHTPEALERLQPQIDALFAKIHAIGEAHAGTRIVLDYAPSREATSLAVDGVVQGEPIRGAEFFRALLRIWLGERPAQADLKRLLLGVEP